MIIINLEEDIKWTTMNIKNRLRALMINPKELETKINDEVLEMIFRRCIDDKYFDEIKCEMMELICKEYNFTIEDIQFHSGLCIDDYSDEVQYEIKKIIEDLKYYKGGMMEK